VSATALAGNATRTPWSFRNISGMRTVRQTRTNPVSRTFRRAGTSTVMASVPGARMR
jgi:hypothetical protein